jgi:hypothetical protein
MHIAFILLCFGYNLVIISKFKTPAHRNWYKLFRSLNNEA